MRFLLLAAAALTLFATPALASEASYSRTMQAISTLNKMPAMQNPSFRTEGDVLATRVLDSANKVIGEVEDVILSPSGSIEALRVDFDRLRLSDDVIINYRDMGVKPVSNGFAVGFEAAQMAAMYPRLLAGIETAAGSEAGNVSIKTLNGAALRTDNGRKIGEVQNVLFGSRGSQAKALFVTMMMGGVGAKQVAIPFNTGDIDASGHRTTITVSEAQATAMRDFIREND